MVKVPADVDESEFLFSIRQPLEWKFYKGWGVLEFPIFGLGTSIFILFGAIWIMITEDFYKPWIILLLLIAGPLFLWLGWGSYWLFQRVRRRYYLKIDSFSLSTSEDGLFVQWIDRTLSSLGARFSRESIPLWKVKTQMMDPIWVYTFPDFSFTLSVVKVVYYPVICIGPVTKENRDEIEEMKAYITDALEHDRQKAIELSEEKYEEIGAALTRLWSS